MYVLAHLEHLAGLYLDSKQLAFITFAFSFYHTFTVI